MSRPKTDKERMERHREIIDGLGPLTRRRKINLIRKAMKYKSGEDSCNSYYMGSMAIAGVMHSLGSKYGMSFKEAAKVASDAQIDVALLKCAWIIDIMRRNPVKKCPCCGQIVSKGMKLQPVAKKMFVKG